MQAKNVMTTKVHSIPSTASVRSAAMSLIANDISGLPVVDDDGHLIGMVTEGDLLRRVASQPLSLLQDEVERTDPQSLEDYIRLNGWSVRDAMSEKVISVGPETDLREVAGIMLSHGIKRVPVIDKGSLIGIVSRCDLLGMVIDAPFDIIASGDESIRLAITSRLKNDLGIDPARIELAVNDSRVQIGGCLDTAVQRRAIRALVESMRGVNGFIDTTTLHD